MKIAVERAYQDCEFTHELLEGLIVSMSNNYFGYIKNINRTIRYVKSFTTVKKINGIDCSSNEMVINVEAGDADKCINLSLEFLKKEKILLNRHHILVALPQAFL